MSAIEAIRSFIFSIRDLANAVVVPGFSFTFWDVGVGSFMVVTGITITKFLLGAQIVETPNSQHEGVTKI